jgi:hypothetical protein
LLFPGVPSAVRVVRRAALPAVVPYVRSGAGGVNFHSRLLAGVTLATILLVTGLAFAPTWVLYAVIGVACAGYLAGMVWLMYEIHRAPTLPPNDEWGWPTKDELDRRATVRHTVGGGTRG